MNKAYSDTTASVGVASSNPFNILVVDDLPDNLRRLSEILSQSGYKVRPAQNGSMALSAAIAVPPDLVLLDIRMPNMDGFDVCLELKRYPQLRNVPVIFVSALDDTADKVRGFAVGGVDYVSKPFQPEEVLARVKTHLELRRLHCSLEKKSDELAQMVKRLQTEIEERTQTQLLLQQEQRTLKRLLQSSDHERRLIAYEIHDGLAQQLAAATMHLDTAQMIRAENPEESQKAFEQGMGMLRRGLEETRRLIADVRPPILDESGVKAAIAHLACDTHLAGKPQIDFHADVRFDRLNPILENAIYRVMQEGITNACRHSQTDRVLVELVQQEDDRIRAEIRDWGVGFDPNTIQEGCFGIEGIRERARLLGGRATIDSQPGQGTHIVALFPMLPV